jgi:hypothetical protein
MVIDGVVALGGAPLAAVMVEVNAPQVVGVPDRTPVVAFRLRPGGTVPVVTLKVGAGLPVAAKV